MQAIYILSSLFLFVFIFDTVPRTLPVGTMIEDKSKIFFCFLVNSWTMIFFEYILHFKFLVRINACSTVKCPSNLAFQYKLSVIKTVGIGIHESFHLNDNVLAIIPVQIWKIQIFVQQLVVYSKLQVLLECQLLLNLSI